MLDKILGRLGLVRVAVLEEQSQFASENLEDIKSLFQKNPIIREFFNWTIEQDIKRFYSAQDSEHPMIRGAVSRTRYFKSLCVTPEEEKSKSQKLDLKRYITNL